MSAPRTGPFESCAVSHTRAGMAQPADAWYQSLLHHLLPLELELLSFSEPHLTDLSNGDMTVILKYGSEKWAECVKSPAGTGPPKAQPASPPVEESGCVSGENWQGCNS